MRLVEFLARRKPSACRRRPSRRWRRLRPGKGAKGEASQVSQRTDAGEGAKGAETLLGRLRDAPHKQRDITLNQVAFELGLWSRDTGLKESEVESEFRTTWVEHLGKTQDDFDKQWSSGFADGQNSDKELLASRDFEATEKGVPSRS